MAPIQKIDDLEPLKIIADPLRLKILRSLMARPATLSQMGRQWKMHPANVRYHLKKLEEAGLVALVDVQQVRGFVEKYYRATSRALLVNMVVTPQSEKREVVTALGSHDLALELVAHTLSQGENTPDMFTLPLGSLDGLMALRQGAGQIAGCHLLDPPTGEYNLPYVRHFFPGQPMRVITLVRRQQGLIVAPGNPLGIQQIADLARDEVRFVNRNRGSGTRLWVDQQLNEKGISAQAVFGYQDAVRTHLEVAERIKQGQADVGVGLYAAAHKMELDFVPLFEERYDVVIPEEYYHSELLKPVLDYVNTAEFRRAVESLGGYNTAEAGKEIQVSSP
jgi:putative molybdopterin biosynthesis protein